MQVGSLEPPAPVQGAPRAPGEEAVWPPEGIRYEVLQSRQHRGRTEYFVRWMNLNNDAPDEWLPAAAVPARLLKRFLKS